MECDVSCWRLAAVQATPAILAMALSSAVRLRSVAGAALVPLSATAKAWRLRKEVVSTHRAHRLAHAKTLSPRPHSKCSKPNTPMRNRGFLQLCRRSVFFLPKYRVGANLKRGVYARAIYNRTTCAQGACVSRVCLAPCGCERSRPGPENESRCMCETGHPAMLMLAGPGEPMR